MHASEMLSGQSETANLRLNVLNGYYQAQERDKAPKAARLYEACLKMIENGYWIPGDRVPSETILVEHLPVGLATVQSVLRHLVADGLVVRRRKTGSFVAKPAGIGRELAYFRFLADDGSSFLDVTDEVMTVEDTTERGAWSAFLGERPSYIRIFRVADIGKEFKLSAALYLGDPRFRPLVHIPVSELMDVSFRIMLHDRFGMPPVQSERRVAFTQLTADQARTLNSKAETPALNYEIRQYTLRDQPLFFMQVLVPENARTLVISEPELQ